ncbi:hypothetical protein DKT69_37245, partial [Micromonospora sicca]
MYGLGFSGALVVPVGFGVPVAPPAGRLAAGAAVGPVTGSVPRVGAADGDRLARPVWLGVALGAALAVAE